MAVETRGAGPHTSPELCRPRQALELISDRWSMIVVKALAEGIRRYGELHRGIDGISQKMLTQTLRSLERDGLVRRTVYPVVPPKVEYELTPLGQSLTEPIAVIGEWAERHLDEILLARQEHDARVERR
ncbi:MAG TPA: helix-turn-helix domain-containing protein [Thermomicrobiales bacterium]|nr:helix-turn-helix domain-containing protein [Thermomicrobiales bacterium]